MPQRGDDWMEHEEDTLTTNWNSMTAGEIAGMLPGRTKSAVYNKYYRMKENGRNQSPPSAEKKKEEKEIRVVKNYVEATQRQGYDVAAEGTVEIKGPRGKVRYTALYVAQPLDERWALSRHEDIDDPAYIKENVTVWYQGNRSDKYDIWKNKDVAGMSQQDFVELMQNIQNNYRDWATQYRVTTGIE